MGRLFNPDSKQNTMNQTNAREPEEPHRYTEAELALFTPEEFKRLSQLGIRMVDLRAEKRNIMEEVMAMLGDDDPFFDHMDFGCVELDRTFCLCRGHGPDWAVCDWAMERRKDELAEKALIDLKETCKRLGINPAELDWPTE
jgi:hypothetical protein